MPLGPSRRSQRGAAALAVTALLVFAMLIVVAVANRNVVVEARASANQYRSAQAFEAAEAGLEWALARLNDGAPMDEDCEPSGDPSQPSFRDRYLRSIDGAGFVPSTWSDAGAAVPKQAACVRGDDGWACACPDSGAASPALPEGANTAPAFRVTFMPGPKPGIVRAVASGCTRAESPCESTSDDGHEAAARLEVSFGLVSGLRARPLAAMTARGEVDAGAASLGLQQLDPTVGGLLLHAGGHARGSALRLQVPAGAALDGVLAADDAALAALDADRFFAHWFGMDPAAWRSQPAATVLACSADCAASLATAVAGGARLLVIDGDASFAGPLTLGTLERPIVLVSSGATQLRGAVELHGVLFAGSLDWRDAPAGGLVHGAVLVSGDYGGNAASDIVHDGRVLARLQTGTGSFARINGSWKDF